jgi:elongator complex protein 2
MEPSQYVLKHANSKGHTRMILGASWTPLDQPTFMTAGRDKSVKIWQITDTEVLLKGTVAAAAAVTAVACSHQLHHGRILFALGTESGDIGIGQAAIEALDNVEVAMVKTELASAKTINQMAWRPARAENEQQIVAVSDDSSLRLYDVSSGNS